MLYKILPENLHSAADRVAGCLRDDRGVAQFKAEEPIDRALQYRPTIHGLSPDGYVVAVEVQDRADAAVLDSAVLDCVSRCLPVRLFLAFPESTTPVPHRVVENLRQRGLGIIEVRESGVVVLGEALPLSLFGYRLDRLRFPKKFRGILLEAENTFRSSSPPKGCAIIYDEIEEISRTIIKKTKKKKMWRKLKAGENPSKLDLDTGAWEKVIELFQSFYIVKKKKVPDLTANLIHRVAATTAYRNEAAHKPKTPEERKQRDREMRTRFESAADLLFDLLKVLDQLKA